MGSVQTEWKNKESIESPGYFFIYLQNEPHSCLNENATQLL